MKIYRPPFLFIVILLNLSSIPCICADAAKAIDFDTLDMQIPADATSSDDRINCILTNPLQPDANPYPIVLILTGSVFPQLKLQNILQFDMYSRTNPIVERNLQTIPSLSPLVQDPPLNAWAITVKPFITYVNRQNFTKDSTQACSYLNFLTNNDFIAILDQFEFSTLNIPEVLPLFSKIQLQMRQVGGMFFLQEQDDYWVTTASMPIILQANNYFLSEADQKKIQDSSLFGGGAGFLSVPSRDFSTFTNDHLIYDQAGIGDLRLETWYKAADSNRGTVECGAQATFPTAHPLLIGMFGATRETLDKKKPIPFVDLQSMFVLYSQSLSGDTASGIQLAEMITDLGIAALDRLSSILLNQSLGQQHVSIGPVFRAIGFTTHQGFAVEITGEVSYYIPGHEVRFFKVVKDPKLFNRDYNDADQAQENLNFLMQEATDTLYPTGVKIKVHPGFMCNITAAAFLLREKYSVMIGYNIWAKSAEKFGNIDTRYPVCDPCAADFSKPRYKEGRPLDFEAGRLSAALQHKLFANITSIIRSHHSYDVRIGLRGDATFASSAIGKDLILALDFIVDF